MISQPMKIIFYFVVLSSLLVFLVSFYVIASAKKEVFNDLTSLTGSQKNGEYIFNAAGCSGCHTAPGSDDRIILSGGKEFVTSFGKFYAPNVSMSKNFGIGAWSLNDFANALKKGVSPSGRHYYPAFPYTTYSRITNQDLVDLWDYWQTLPTSDSLNKPHKLQFPFSVRSLIGPWKTMFLNDEWVVMNSDERGRYLVEALGHCAECHTPRNLMGGLKVKSWMNGGINPSGLGNIPNLRQSIDTWSVDDIAEYLFSGFTPEFDVVGGSMAEVIESTKFLNFDDRIAIANYLKNIGESAK